jgi:hypothetical protein
MLNPDEYRVVTHTVDADDASYIAVVRRDPETDKMSDEEIIKGLETWKLGQRHLHAVGDE